MTTPSFKAVVLAAGLGTRMKSKLPKVMHQVLGWPMVFYPIERALAAGAEQVAVVVGYGKEQVEAALAAQYADDWGTRVVTFEQKQMLGTADAVKAALSAYEDYDGAVMILSGDVPNVSAEVIAELAQSHANGHSPVSLVSAHDATPNQYGRVVRDAHGDVLKIVEFKDGNEEERAITEVNMGAYLVDAPFLCDALTRIDSNNAAGEFYLTALIELAAAASTPAQAIVLDDIDALHGVNDRVQLARATAYARRKRNEAIMRTGVTMIAPDTVTIDMDASVESDVMIETAVTLVGTTRVGSGATLQAGVRLENQTVADGSVVTANGTA